MCQSMRSLWMAYIVRDLLQSGVGNWLERVKLIVVCSRIKGGRTGVADGVAILSVPFDGFECGNRSRTIRDVYEEGFMLHAHASKLIWILDGKLYGEIA
jgi:hypothetical protein